MGRSAVTTFKLPFIQSFKDRHGHVRRYFRRPGQKLVALPGQPGSKAFMDAYQAALAGSEAPSAPIGSSRTQPGSLSALIVAYYQSSDFTRLRPITQSTYRNVIERIRDEHGDKPVAKLESHHIRRMLDERAATPGAANNYLKSLRTLMTFAVQRGWRRDNPTTTVRRVKTRPGGYRAWTESDIALFAARWPSGSKPRLALALLLYTAQRRADVIAMGRQHIRDGRIYLRQQKTGTALAIPIHPDLARELEFLPRDQLTFLQTQAGSPFTAPGFTNWFVERARMAGLPSRSSPHGLRKAAARRLAEAGCTAHEIMAITGHLSLNQVAPYTATADQERLATTAIESMRKYLDRDS